MNPGNTNNTLMNNHDHNTKGIRPMRNGALAPLCIIVVLLLLAACSSIDCPMNNLVYTQYQLMRADGQADTLSDTLTVYTNRHDGSDSVIINLEVGAKVLDLPISYAQAVDSFFIVTKDTLTKTVFRDTLTVEKENRIHFESTDCGVSYFHKLTSVNSTKHRIDSVRIINPDVNYETSRKHFYIYFSPEP